MNGYSGIDPQVGYPSNHNPGGSYQGGQARPAVSAQWGPARQDPQASMPYVGSRARRSRSDDKSTSYRNDYDSYDSGSSGRTRRHSDVPYPFHPIHAAAIPIFLAPVGAAVLGPKILFTACVILLAIGIVGTIAYYAHRRFQETRRDSDMYGAMVSQTYQSRNY